MKYWMIAGALLLGASGAAHASTPSGFILGQGDDGNVYKIGTADASVSLFADLDPIPGIAPNSPNGLGYNINEPKFAFRTDYNDASTPNTLFRNNEALITIPGSSQSVASGDVIGDTFYYLNRNGEFYSVDGIFDPAGTQTVTLLADIASADQTYGDLAIRGDTAYVSLGQSFGAFDITNPAAGFTSLVDVGQLYAGIAFDGDTLYGFTASQNTLSNQLFSISLAAGTFGMGSLIGDIVLSDVLLTDAAPKPVPLPSAALLLLGSFVGLRLLRRRHAAVA